MTKPKPYIGITGFMSREQVDEVLAVMPADCRANCMVGVLVSDRSMAGRPDQPSRYPAVKQLANIFSDHPQAFNVIHFNTRSPKKLADELNEVFELAGPLCHGVQLNLTWPNPAEVAKLRTKWADKQIILQLGSRAFKDTGSRPEGALRFARKYYLEYIDYILMDMSAGLGVPLDANLAQEFIEHYLQSPLRESCGLGIAGGLSAESLSAIAGIIRHSQFLSIDAEGSLRELHDNLDIARAQAYLRAASALYMPLHQ